MENTAETYDAEELKAAHPGAELQEFSNEEFKVTWVVKVPAPGDFQSFRAQQNAAGDDLFPINRGFLLNHVVWPGRAEVMKQVKEHAGLVEAGVKRLIVIAGSRAEFTVKKL